MQKNKPNACICQKKAVILQPQNMGPFKQRSSKLRKAQ